MKMGQTYYLVEFDAYELRQDWRKLNPSCIGWRKFFKGIRDEHPDIGNGKKFKTKQDATKFLNQVKQKYSQSPWREYIYQTEGAGIYF